MPKTRRAGRKNQIRRLFTQYKLEPANSIETRYLGLSEDNSKRINNINCSSLESELDNRSEIDITRREGYNPKVPWPFKLIPITVRPSRIPLDKIPLIDPRRDNKETKEPLPLDNCMTNNK